MAETTGSRRQAVQSLISHDSPLPTRIMGQLSLNLGPSLELQTAEVIGYLSKVEQPSCSPGFPLPMQTMESPSAPLERSSEPRTEVTPGQMRRAEQAMIFREFP